VKLSRGLILICTILSIFFGFIFIYKFLLSPKNCNLYIPPMSEREIKECTCPIGYKKFISLARAYCATSSEKPCKSHEECPKGEHCISDDGKEWFCTGRVTGCYFSAEKPNVRVCVD
jgi:hypothetical protein